MVKIEIKDGRSMIGDVDVTTWSEADRKALLESVNATQGALATAQALIEDKKRASNSPQAILARAREEQEAAEELRASLERATIEDLAWGELRKQYGKNRVKRLDTKEGMVVVRAPKEQETIDQGLAMVDIAPAERAIVARNYLASLVVYPQSKPDEPPKVREYAEKWPGLWDDLDVAVKLLQSSRADELRPFV